MCQTVIVSYYKSPYQHDYQSGESTSIVTASMQVLWQLFSPVGYQLVVRQFLWQVMGVFGVKNCLGPEKEIVGNGWRRVVG